jgi:hypothetical protein
MIKIIAFALLAFFSNTYIANGQIQKGSVLLGGQIYASGSDIKYSASQQQPNNNFKQTYINLSIGKAFNENSIYGFNVSYAPTSATNFYNQLGFGNLRQYSIDAGVFYRKYKQLGHDFYLFAEAGLLFQYTQQTFTDSLGHSLSSSKQPLVEIYLTPGISYKLLKKLHVELSIPYLAAIGYAVTTTQTSRQKQFLFNTSLNSRGLYNLSVGFHFILQ